MTTKESPGGLGDRDQGKNEDKSNYTESLRLKQINTSIALLKKSSLLKYPSYKGGDNR
jgi:hypothetical protein